MFSEKRRRKFDYTTLSKPMTLCQRCRSVVLCPVTPPEEEWKFFVKCKCLDRINERGFVKDYGKKHSK